MANYTSKDFAIQEKFQLIGFEPEIHLRQQLTEIKEEDEDNPLRSISYLPKQPAIENKQLSESDFEELISEPKRKDFEIRNPVTTKPYA